MLARTASRAAVLAVSLALIPAGAAFAQGGATTTGTSNRMNPAVSLNGLFLAGWSDPTAGTDGFTAEEFELAVSSVVDPYFKSFATIAYAPDPAGDETAVAVEEAYVRTLGLPAGLGLRAGRFYLPLGRHNQLHTHQFPFVEAPLGVRDVLGDESLGDTGVELSYAPELPWYGDLLLTLTDGAAEGFAAEEREMAVGARLENLWETGEAATLEGAVSVLDGPGPEGGRRTLYGADARWKWRDPRRTYGRAVNVVAEVLLDRRPGAGDVLGAYVLAQVRFARRWWGSAGWSVVSLAPVPSTHRRERHETRAQLAWVPSEFSALRGEVAWIGGAGEPRELATRLQLNFTIGAHPAHRY